MPTAVLRRYTPPTCTLELAAAGSALSRWSNRMVLKNLRFQLSFDDPKLMSDQQVMVSGDQSQLEALYETVTDYVQHLVSSPVNPAGWEPSLLGNPAQLLNAPAVLEPLRSESDMALQAKGLLSHELRLGSLANPESGATVRLSTLQLFDLANALEAYHAEMISLPLAEAKSGKLAWMPQLSGRWSTAAAAVLALGATAAMSKFVLDISRPASQTASVSAERQVNAELNRELFPKLAPPPASPSVTLQPLPLPPPNAATDATGLPPIGVTTAPPPAAPQAGAVGEAAAPIASQSAGQSQVTILPSPNDLAATPPRLAAAEADVTAESRAAAPAGNPAPASTANSTATNSTAFDSIPQVAEVRGYFQQRWQPPDGLSQTLEYRLLLNADGSLQRIVPLGQFSENYLDRTNMPLLGEPFVSASSGKTPQIRLVLKPNGQVQSFLEYAN